MTIDDEVEQLAEMWSKPARRPKWHSFVGRDSPVDVAEPCAICHEPWDSHTGYAPEVAP